MKIVLRPYARECVCGRCGFSARSIFAHFGPCPKCGLDFWNWRIARWTLTGPWYAPWRWRYGPEEVPRG